MIWSLLLLIGSVFAGGAQDLKAQILLKAKSLDHLRFETKEYGEYEKTEIKCEMEINHKVLPVSCYKQLYIKRKHLSKKDYNEQLKKLDEICEDSQIKGEKIKYSPYLSEACKKIVERSTQELNYIQREQNPLGYFKN